LEIKGRLGRPLLLTHSRLSTDITRIHVIFRFSLVEQNKDALDPQSREVYELMRSAFEGDQEAR
jgi:hypothetical protein